MNKTNVKNQKNSGASMVFVMAALIVTGFVAAAMIKLVNSDRLGGAFYTTSETARSAAKSGIIAAITWFEDGSRVNSEILPMLRTWIATAEPDPVWIIGNNSGSAGTDYKELDSDGKMRYRTRMTAFDTTTFNVTLVSEGIGKNGSRASMTSVYTLEGLEFDIPDNSIRPTNALHLGGGAGEIDVVMKVHGGFYIKGEGFSYSQKQTGTNVNDASEFIDIYGNIYVDYRAGKKFVFKKTNIHGNAYFKGNVRVEYFEKNAPNPLLNRQDLLIDGNLGFENLLKFYGSGIGFDVRGNVYMGATSTSGKVISGTHASYTGHPWLADSIDLNGNDLYMDKDATFNLGTGGLTSYTEVFRQIGTPYLNEDDMNVRVLSGVDEAPVIAIDIDKITSEPGVVVQTPVFHGKTGAGMNAYCATVPAHEKYRDENGKLWTVMKWTQSADAFAQGVDNTYFDSSLIIIVDGDDMDLDTKMYNHRATGIAGVAADAEESRTTGGITLIYVANGSRITGIGGPNNFRGFVFSESNEENIYRCMTGGNFIGGVYQTDQTSGKFRLEGAPLPTAADAHNHTFDVYFDSNVMDELEALGVFYDPSVNISNPTLVLKATNSNIIGNLVSQSL